MAKFIVGPPLYLNLAVVAPKGESAYEIAVKNGYVGTETEWLNSLGNSGGGGGGGSQQTYIGLDTDGRYYFDVNGVSNGYQLSSDTDGRVYIVSGS